MLYYFLNLRKRRRERYEHEKGDGHHHHNGQHHYGQEHPHGRHNPRNSWLSDSLGEKRLRHFIAWSTAVFTAATFILFLLAGLSVPIIKSIWLVTLQAESTSGPIVTSVATQLRFGVWGICAVGRDGTKNCYGPQLGYSLESPINLSPLIATANPALVNAVLTGLTTILILHPVCAGLAFVVFLTCCLLKNHAISIVALVFAIILSIISSVSLAIDLALVIELRQKVPALTNNRFSVGFGPVVWMVVVAVGCAWLSVVVLSMRACLCCGMRRKY